MISETKAEQAVVNLSTLMARVAGFAILITAIIIFVEVVVRKLFSESVIGADEISGYVLAISVTWGLSLALVRKAHVRIDVLYAILPRGVGGILDIAAVASLLIFGSLTAWYATKLMMTNAKVGAVSNTLMEVPLVLPQTLWVAGLWIFNAVCVVMIVLLVRAFFRGDLARVRSLAGIRGAEEEAREEAEFLQQSDDGKG